jgi:thiol-disulfide isomerase/thioredoxin
MFEFYSRLPVNIRYVVIPMVLLAILAIIIVVAVSLSNKSKFSSTKAEDVAKKTVVYFFMPSCPHCIDFAPTWKNIKSKLAEKDKTLRIIEVDVSTNGLPDGVPVGVVPPPFVPAVVANRQVYQGKRTVKDVVNFVLVKTGSKNGR